MVHPPFRRMNDRPDPGRDYLDSCIAALESASGRFDLAIYNAGMDPHEDCPLGGRKGVTSGVLEERERLVFDFCRTNSWPVAFVLAGGYVGPNLSLQQLIDLHRLTIEAAAQHAK
jgi:acetoin utilization deacetylase AcuC-like enzyme